MPRRLQRSRVKGWRKPAGAVVVDRTSRWGNPFVVREKKDGVYGGDWSVIHEHEGRSEGRFGRYTTKIQAQRRAVHLYRVWLTETAIGKETARRAREQLAGKDLVCWCDPGSPCHADVLIEAANGECA